jgi:hypothetical protein
VCAVIAILTSALTLASFIKFFGVSFLSRTSALVLGDAKRRAASPWLCGYATEADCHRYAAHNFYGEIKRYFRWVGGAPAPEPHDEPILKER